MSTATLTRETITRLAWRIDYSDGRAFDMVYTAEIASRFLREPDVSKVTHATILRDAETRDILNITYGSTRVTMAYFGVVACVILDSVTDGQARVIRDTPSGDVMVIDVPAHTLTVID